MTARRLVLSVLALLAPCSRAAAGAFEPRDVPSAARWVLHVDFEALARSTILRALHENGQYVENDFDLDHVQKDFGLDPFVDLRSLTMYGVGAKGADVVTVISGTDRLERAWEKISSKAKAVRVGGRDVRVLGERHFALQPVRAGARIAVVATSASALQSAFVVLDREARSLADAPQATEAAIAARPATGSLVFAAGASGVGVFDDTVFYDRALGLFAELAALSREDGREFALLTRGLEFDLCEVRGDVTLRSSFEAKTPGEADRLEQIVRGSIAAASTNDTSDAGRRLRGLLGALRVESPASKLLLSYRYGASALVTDVAFVEKARAASESR